MAKDKDYMRLIARSRWLRVRKEAMNRAHCLCERCAREGLAVPATEAHHVIPVETAIDYAGKERLMYDASNVQCLCHRCHLEAHKELGKGGKAGNRKRQEEKLQEFKRRFLGE